MYSSERNFVRMKSYVRNRSHPEGSIAEGYIAEECLTFCSRYLDGVETRFNRPIRNPDPPKNGTEGLYLFSSAGSPIGKIENIILDEKSWIQAHRYVLRHYDDLEPFRQQFIDSEKRKRRRHTRLSGHDIEKLVNERFHEWFQSKVVRMDDSTISEEMQVLGNYKMSSSSRRLRNCNIITSTSQDDLQGQEPLGEEQVPSYSESPTNTSNTEIENNNQNELFLWIIGVDKNRRKKRGRTTLADVWNLLEGERIDVEVDKYGVPCTYAGSVLGSFLGVIAKNGTFAPLNIPRWDNQTFNPFKEKMLKHIEAKFRYPDGTRHWVLASLNKKWRDYKSELKSEYFSYDKPIQELINNVPLGVIRDQWTSLIAHWSTEESKNLCRVNSTSAKLVKMAHTSGRKSYARKRKEMEIALGKEPDRLTFWEVTHKKKNGNFVNKDAEDSLDLARAKFVTLSQGSESDTNKLMDKAFLDIMGPEHNGRVKGLGLRPTLRSYYGVKHTNLPTTSESREGQPGEVEKLKEEMQEMRDELHRLKTLFSDTMLLNSRVVAGDNNLIDALFPNIHSSNASHEPTNGGHQKAN